MSSSTGRGAPWWQVALAHDGGEVLAAGEPWAGREPDGGCVADLSDDQRAMLTGDQPPIPRLRDLRADPDVAPT